MDVMRFRSLCANVDRLSAGQVRELRRKLRALDARREVLAGDLPDQIAGVGEALQGLGEASPQQVEAVCRITDHRA